jgi:acetylornithine/succinyldiaminopimelate/putrescine aminotransferase/choline dehydrogenase-like flavoprotein
MSDFKQQVEEYLASSAHTSKRHVHPRLLKMLELGGMSTAFTRGEGPYLYDAEGTRYLDFLAGGGVYFIGRNHPKVREYMQAVLSMDLPNLCVVNASVLGGQLAERLIGLAGSHFSKVVYANSGTEATDVMVRFARYVTGRRRFLYLEGAFHGRSYAAISMCGFPQLKEGMDPVLPTCTPIKPNDLRQLRRELRHGDVAGVIMEPVLGMTGEVLDPGYMREAEILCERYGSIFMADEVQTGFGRTGEWFGTTSQGIRPGMMSLSKTLSGGQAPISAVLVTEDVYEAVYKKFTSGPIYFSTFAENNLSMAAALATLDVLEEMDAPAEAAEKGEYLREGIEELADRYDVIDRVQGKGLMLAVYFKTSAKPTLLLQQKLLEIPDSGAFAAAVNVDLYARQKVIVQIPGPGLNAIKILPPVVISQDDMDLFLHSFEDTLLECYGRQGPLVSLGKGILKNVVETATEALPDNLVPPALKGSEKKKPRLAAPDPAPSVETSDPDDFPVFEYGDYNGQIQDQCDFLVVGSGPGGALVAHELAKSGKRVIVVEAGPKLRKKDYQEDTGKTLTDYFWEGGTRTTMGNIVMPTMQARCLGGGSVFNSAICLRATPAALGRWAEEHGVEELSPEDLLPHYEAVEAFMGVRPVEDAVQGRRNELFKLGCEELGWHGEPILRNEEGCVGSGECLIGCRAGAKLSTDRRGIKEMVELGGRVYTSVQADKLIIRNYRVHGIEGSVVHPSTRKRGQPVRILAKCTVLAAGAVATPAIMRHSGLTREPVGADFRLHPSGFHMGFFAEKVESWKGATQGYHCLEFLDEGIKLESMWASTALLALRFPGSGKQLKRYLSKYAQVSTWATWVSGEDSTGTVRALPNGRPAVNFNLANGDVRRLQEANAKLAELFFAAGAQKVITGLNGLPPELQSLADVDELRSAKMVARDFPTASNHAFGGCCMGGDPERHATDSWGQVYEIDDLYVCDTGLYPSSPGVNPQLLVMALAHRLGNELPYRY